MKNKNHRTMYIITMANMNSQIINNYIWQLIRIHNFFNQNLVLKNQQ